MAAGLPKNLEIEITNFCNLNCLTCRRGRADFHQEPRRDMTLDEFKAIIDQFPELETLQFCGEAENTLNPELPEMIEYARNKGVKWIEMFTNGTTLNRVIKGTAGTVAERLAKTSINKVKFSIDGAREETYKMHRGTSLAGVLANIREFRDMTDIPFGIEMVVDALNIDELSEVPAMAEQIGAKEIEFRLVGWVADGLDELIVSNERMDMEVVRVKEEMVAHGVENLVYTSPGRAHEQECLIGDWVNVDSRGRMTVCYYRDQDIVVNLLEENLAEKWEAQGMVEKREAHMAKDFGTECCCPFAVYCKKG